MTSGCWFCVLVCISAATSTASISLYDYYKQQSITSGLAKNEKKFILNGVELQIMSGSFHYFRVYPDYWRITLRKMKAAGLNTVTTYMPWNLHNPRMNEHDFGDLDDGMSQFLDLPKFVKIAREEELFVILRPGPFIGADWDFGGMPSWLLRDPSMQIRSQFDGFTDAVSKYYLKIHEKIEPFLYINEGSVIAIQIENDFGYYGYNDLPRDKTYLKWLKSRMDGIGFESLMYFTSDSILDTGYWGNCPEVLETANIRNGAYIAESLDKLETLQPNNPSFVMDISMGTYNYWISENNQDAPKLYDIIEDLQYIFDKDASFNLYMFVGGTNFGFMAGADLVEDWTDDINAHLKGKPVNLLYKPITTSYDYDAPIAENGDYNNDKFHKISEVIQQNYLLWNDINIPDLPSTRVKGPDHTLKNPVKMDFNTLCSQVKEKIELTNGSINMEALNINGLKENFNGQSYGYVVYEAHIKLKQSNNKIQIMGHVRDMAQLFVNDVEQTKQLYDEGMVDKFGYWNGRDKEIDIEISPESGEDHKITIVVENLGRVSTIKGKPHFFNQRKGIYEGPILINGEEQLKWMVTPLEFKMNFVNNLDGWKTDIDQTDMPVAYKFVYSLPGSPKDVFIDTSNWQKGVIFVNGFNLGRYWTFESHKKTMYLPAPLLKAEFSNEIIVFEQYKPSELVLKLVQTSHDSSSAKI